MFIESVTMVIYWEHDFAFFQKRENDGMEQNEKFIFLHLRVKVLSFSETPPVYLSSKQWSLFLVELYVIVVCRGVEP